METVTAIPRPRERAPAVAAAGLIALAVGMGIGRFAFTPILPMMQQDAGVSVADGGWLAFANYLGYLLGALVAIGVRVPPTAVIRAGLAGIALVTLGMALAHSFDAWLLLRGVAGFASAWVLVFASSWSLSRLGALGRPRLGGVVFAGVGTGMAAAGGLCLFLLHRHGGSTGAWLASGALALVGTAAIWRTLRGEPGGERTLEAGAPSSRTRARDHLTIIVCYGVFGFGYIIPATFVPAMARQLVADPAVFGWSWPLFGAAAAISTLLASAATRRLGNRRLWALSHGVMALGVVAPVASPTIGGVMIAALLVGGTFMVATMTGMREAAIVAGPHASRLMAVMTAAFATGQTLGPLLVTRAVGPTGDFSRPLMLAALALLASALALLRRAAGDRGTN